MKIAVVYYSLEGNTKYAAEQIADNLGADLIELTTLYPYPTKGFAKFFHGGKSAVFAEKPRLNPYRFKDTAYDKVIIGCPVWASKCAPPINTFLADHGDALKKLGGKNIGILLCQSGNGAQKVLAKYKADLGVSKFGAELVLIDPKKNAGKHPDDAAAIKAFCEAIAGEK